MSVPSLIAEENLFTISCRKRFTSDGPYGPASRIAQSGLSIFDTAKMGLSQKRMRTLLSKSFGFSGMPHGSASMRLSSRRHSSIDLTSCFSTTMGSDEKRGRELRPKPSTSIAYTGRSRASASKFNTHSATPAPRPCSSTSGTFGELVFSERVHIQPE
uniref:Uncharacterized protein n=1 Tax=Anopheles atroparvus TaxID=41427 RepID=A0A182JH21_ANOAO